MPFRSAKSNNPFNPLNPMTKQLKERQRLKQIQIIEEKINRHRIKRMKRIPFRAAKTKNPCLTTGRR